ncbi:MAG TPA: crosslink repair DNA glycosylase YcaQ family protein [Candidatus Limnocylindrales bacterium]|nr:crosslink repair DNA glycosylase YcaQ family protein [Candidatus Limnocylindrales bacterium]
MAAILELTREQILAFRRRVGALDERLPGGAGSLRTAAWAGLQDSMPRAALLSLHARVEGIGPGSWEDPELVQLWGPRFSAYVVAADSVAPFTLGRLDEPGPSRRKALDIADRMAGFLNGRRMRDRDLMEGIGIGNAIRYVAPTGRFLIRWEGARAPEVWEVPAPDVAPAEARADLARRYVHVFGPTGPERFAGWAGVGEASGRAAFEALTGELTRVRTPLGERWILSSDEPTFRTSVAAPAAARLLPSGDTYYLLWGIDRELLIPDANHRAELWTSRVWPGALLVDGEIVGTWRRSNEKVSIQPWRRLTTEERDAVATEAASLPLPGVKGRIVVNWAEPT